MGEEVEVVEAVDEDVVVVVLTEEVRELKPLNDFRLRQAFERRKIFDVVYSTLYSICFYLSSLDCFP